MSDIFKDGVALPFPKLAMAEEYIKRLQSAAYKIDIITLNEVMAGACVEMPEDHEWRIKSLHYGYSRREIKKLRPVKARKGFVVNLPEPSLMVRNEKGYWTTERELNKKE